MRYFPTISLLYNTRVLFVFGLIVGIIFLSNELVYGQSTSTSTPKSTYMDGFDRERHYWGINYTLPFAFSYRWHKKQINSNIKKSIDEDVYHFSLMGIDAFRVHVWDTEVSDTLGNLLTNEHVDLLDYLIFKLKQQKIKVILTPIAFWNNGYPEKDEPTPGFSYLYGKSGGLKEPKAIEAQARYIKQFLSHRNRYTRTTYAKEPDLIGVEINNEPAHTGSQSQIAQYIFTMYNAIRSTGFQRPIFYNAPEPPAHDSVAIASPVEGITFQWYPTRLVHGVMRTENYIPHALYYPTPMDRFKGYDQKIKIVYEFDAADMMSSIMYPLMARAFKNAGFEWATMFSYDPLSLAKFNSEYPTHYLNLAYTPQKAVSYMIAGHVFRHHIPNADRHTPPAFADTILGDVTLSYHQNRAVLNNDSTFYYTGDNDIVPRNLQKLKKIVGVGSSPIVTYRGRGVYFLTKIKSGVWQLQVFPDAVPLQDPFLAKDTLTQVVSKLVYGKHTMQIALPDFGKIFFAKNLQSGHVVSVKEAQLWVEPGTYLLSRGELSTSPRSPKKSTSTSTSHISKHDSSTVLVHIPAMYWNRQHALHVEASVFNIKPRDEVWILIRNKYGRITWEERLLENQQKAYQFYVDISANRIEVDTTFLPYQVVVRHAESEYMSSFPGGIEYVHSDSFAKAKVPYYHTSIVQTKISPLVDMNDQRDLTRIDAYSQSDDYGFLSYSHDPLKTLQLKGKGSKLAGSVLAFQLGIKEKEIDIHPDDSIIFQARSLFTDTTYVKLLLIDDHLNTYAKTVVVGKTLSRMALSAKDLQPDSMLLLPRPYPPFGVLAYPPQNTSGIKGGAVRIEKIQLSSSDKTTADNQDKGFEIGSIYLLASPQ